MFVKTGLFNLATASNRSMFDVLKVRDVLRPTLPGALPYRGCSSRVVALGTVRSRILSSTLGLVKLILVFLLWSLAISSGVLVIKPPRKMSPEIIFEERWVRWVISAPGQQCTRCNARATFYLDICAWRRPARLLIPCRIDRYLFQTESNFEATNEFRRLALELGEKSKMGI